MIEITSSYPFPRARLCAFAVVVLSLLAVSAASASEAAAAGSGGIGGGTDERQDSSSAGEAKYTRAWQEVSRRDRRWAHDTAQCESGGNPKAIGGGGLYRGAFQFMRETWASSPKSPGGDPIDYSYTTQAVVAIALMHRDGAGHWPNCG